MAGAQEKDSLLFIITPMSFSVADFGITDLPASCARHKAKRAKETFLSCDCDAHMCGARKVVLDVVWTDVM